MSSPVVIVSSRMNPVWYSPRGGTIRIVVSPLEMADRVVYSIETLEHFRRENPGARVFLILGEDSCRQLDTWRRWREILEIAELAVLERPGGGDQAEPSAALAAALADARVHRVGNAPLAISSTEIRRRLAGRSENLDQLVPRLVLDYIDKYDLYR